ncbi:DUF6941 family protein [Kribbella sp. CA-294648]|uniref:DUF6941 family protein n=1 Tax=Kribbella sp. CA-294648 TaxID=3239948 RepID=UPI003D91F828
MLLCDHVQVADGKLFISGGGWSVTGPGPFTSALALKFDVPWDRTNEPFALFMRLLGEDGEPVTQPGPAGDTAIEVRGSFEVGRPAGLKQGTPIDVPLAINIPVLALAPGKRYSWHLQINGEEQEDWHLSFSTRPSPEMNQAPQT